MESRRSDHTNLELIRCPSQYRLQTSKMNYKRFQVFSEDLVAVELFKPTSVLSKPIYKGASVLDLSKAHMYNAIYNILKKHLPKVQWSWCFLVGIALLININFHPSKSNYPFTMVYKNRNRLLQVQIRSESFAQSFL